MTNKKMIRSLRNLIPDWPRLLIMIFLFSLFAAAPFVGISLSESVTDVLIRIGMNGILVLSLLPMIHSGCGLNFGLPLAVVAGLLGATITIEMNVTGPFSFVVALLVSTPFAVLFGWGYGKLLNRVKGGEMMISTYVGFSSVAFMSMMWLVLPFKSPNMIWGYAGKGLRTTISLEDYYSQVLNKFLAFKIGETLIPLGLILFLVLICFLVWCFSGTKTGMAVSATGANPRFAEAAGVNTEKMRILSVIFSTWLGALGTLVYQQGFGFAQLYMGPFYMAFPAVSAILIGGASLRRAGIGHVFLGTFLFQGILTMTPSVINSAIKTDMSEVLRIIVSNGMILYALTRTGSEKRGGKSG